MPDSSFTQIADAGFGNQRIQSHVMRVTWEIRPCEELNIEAQPDFERLWRLGEQAVIKAFAVAQPMPIVYAKGTPRN